MLFGIGKLNLAVLEKDGALKKNKTIASVCARTQKFRYGQRPFRVEISMSLREMKKVA